MTEQNISRRSLLKSVAGSMAAGTLLARSSAAAPEESTKSGRIKQSVSRWCFNSIPYEEFVKECKQIGLVGIDLVARNDWDLVKKYDMVATMVPGAGSIAEGTIRKENHARMLENFKKNIKDAAEYGWPNVITFSGERKGMSEEEGLDNSVIVLKEAARIAEDAGVTICMELLNSKVDHPDYMCDHSAWGIELCKRVASPRFKLLYDIYHMQIMEGDVVKTILDNHSFFAHYHTAGIYSLDVNKYRRDIDQQQELDYVPVMKAIAQTGYEGYVAHEFVPKNGMDSLRHAYELCNI